MAPRPRAPRWFLPAFAGLFVVAVAIVVVIGRLGGGDGDDGPREFAPGRGTTAETIDPLSYSPGRRGELERRAASGLSHVLYAKSPGGAIATAARVARWRPLIERAVDGSSVDADMVEAIIFLESAGRPDARASDDLEGAVGLTQILAETATNLLGMEVDVARSERLTRGISRGRKVAQRTRARRKADERFDPAKALAATVRYLELAEKELDREDLAIVSYHMGIGNLKEALERFDEGTVPYAELFFDSTPLRHEKAWRFLASLGDDSSTYLWRVLAAREIMRLSREDRPELDRRVSAHASKNSAEEVLHPAGETVVYEEPFALGRARASGELTGLGAQRLADHGLRIDPRMGELAGRIKQSPRLYRALRPEAHSLLLYLGAGVREITGRERERLTVTSTVRDTTYQRVLARRNSEATRAYSLHTTGFAFDISRDYASRKQALAFQFWLDRLQALDLIAWVREPGAIHVTVSARAAGLTRFVR